MVDKKLGTYKEGAVLPSSRMVRDENNFTTFSRKTASNPQSDHAKELDGSYGGFQPKPAVEVILVAMKPLSEKTFVDQTLENGKGVTWLDDCRIPYEYEDIPTERKEHVSTIAQMSVVRTDYKTNSQDRITANLLVSDDALNDGKVTKGSAHERHNRIGIFGQENKNICTSLGYPDSGSFSRYFDLDKWFAKKLEELPENVRKTFPYLLVPKASKSAKTKGLETLS